MKHRYSTKKNKHRQPLNKQHWKKLRIKILLMLKFTSSRCHCQKQAFFLRTDEKKTLDASKIIKLPWYVIVSGNNKQWRQHMLPPIYFSSHSYFLRMGFCERNSVISDIMSKSLFSLILFVGMWTIKLLVLEVSFIEWCFRDRLFIKSEYACHLMEFFYNLKIPWKI